MGGAVGNRIQRFGVGLLRFWDTRLSAISRSNNTMAEMNGVPAQAHLGKMFAKILGDFAGIG